jgi:hypothetical protein
VVVGGLSLRAILLTKSERKEVRNVRRNTTKQLTRERETRKDSATVVWYVRDIIRDN